MPLIHSKSPAALRANMRTLMGEIGHSPHVQSRKQAIAIGLETQRRAAKKQFGGAAGMPFGVGAGVGMGGAGGYMPMPGAGAGIAPQAALPAPAAAPMPTGGGMPMPQAPMLRGAPAAMPAMPMAGMRGAQPSPAMGGGGGQQAWWQSPQIMALLSRFRGGMGGGYGNMKRGGGTRMQAGGLPMMPWFARAESRNLAHGFIKSPVPGRTDALPISVKGSAYVVPADHVAHLGQSNSLAGANVLNKMFGQTPSGQAPLKPGHPFRMPGLPRPPKLPGAKGIGMSARGGTEHAGGPTPIVAAGGEYIIEPESIIRKFGSLERGHKILDHWINETRKKHIKTLRALKPPKKS